jgi:hypothetical protein
MRFPLPIGDDVGMASMCLQATDTSYHLILQTGALRPPSLAATPITQ